MEFYSVMYHKKTISCRILDKFLQEKINDVALKKETANAEMVGHIFLFHP